RLTGRNDLGSYADLSGAVGSWRVGVSPSRLSLFYYCWSLHNTRHGVPAMASGLTDHIWSIGEVLTRKIAPAPWVEPKRRGRPRSRPLPDPTVPRRPRGRPRKLA
ncbi:MAG TPA: hypothetical protein VJ761_07000, partial [Ktedonobacteraceae bacterium]|nr:hypothetical protein [Ktedonobacteraceae bacterium]